MTEIPTRERIRDAACGLFREHGYAGVTIRAVAEAASISPALVMKLFGSKASLYAASTPQVGLPSTANVPFEELGSYLVSRVLARIRTGESDPWAQGVFLTWQSPDPDVERRNFTEQVLVHVSVHLADVPDARDRVDAVACQMVGLALGLRTLRLRDHADEERQAAFIDRYSRQVQATLEGRA